MKRIGHLLALLLVTLPSMAGAAEFQLPPKTFYRSAEVNGHKLFYREAGDPAKATIVLLHGYPSSSHTYRELIPMLSPYYHVIAPDDLGSGYSDHPDPDIEPYTFDRLAESTHALLRALKLTSYTLYMQDFGAPVGFRLMQRDPDAVAAIIVQNANAYLDGLTPERRAFFLKAHEDRSPEMAAMLFERTGEDSIINKQYLRDVPPGKRDIVSPDSWTHDLAFLRSEKDRKIQVQLFQDYQTNIDLYPAWQTLMRERQFPALIVWGRNDPAFISAGAEAYLRDLPKAELHLIDAGHFAVEEQSGVVAEHVLRFMQKNAPR
jgi:pimeloyl-ACP methyl ester carboxylesterase